MPRTRTACYYFCCQRRRVHERRGIKIFGRLQRTYETLHRHTKCPFTRIDKFKKKKTDYLTVSRRDSAQKKTEKTKNPRSMHCECWKEKPKKSSKTLISTYYSSTVFLCRGFYVSVPPCPFRIHAFLNLPISLAPHTCMLRQFCFFMPEYSRIATW